MKSTGPLKCAIAGFLCTKFELNQIKIGLALFHTFSWLGWSAWVKLDLKHNVMNSHYAKFLSILELSHCKKCGRLQQ